MTREELLDELEYYGDIERPNICPISNGTCCYDRSEHGCSGCPVDEEFKKDIESEKHRKMRKFIVETEDMFDRRCILNTLTDIFPKCDFKVTEIAEPTYENWCKSVSECTEDEVNCAECSSASVKETVTKQIELVEE